MIFSSLYFSEFLDLTLLDSFGHEMGDVVDAAISLDEGYPVLTALMLKKRDNVMVYDWNDVRSMDRHYIFGKQSAVAGNDFPSDNYLFLKRDLLDHQIVDINGRKVVRINDLKLAEINSQPRLVAVDVGLTGLLRRLGVSRMATVLLRLFNCSLKDELIFWDDVERIETQQTRVKLAVPYRKLSKLHPADLADILEELGNAERSSILAGLDLEIAAEALQEVEADVQAEILENIGGERASDLLEAMPPDEAAEILGELEEERAEELLNLMEADEAAEVREILEYEEETAGRLMTTDFVCFNKDLNTEQTINKLREMSPDAESIFYLYVVDQAEHLLGVVSLRDLVVAKPDTTLEAIIKPKIIYVRDDAPHNEVAGLIAKYNLLAIPVVDEANVLVGMVNINDVMDVVMPSKWKREFERMGKS